MVAGLPQLVIVETELCEFVDVVDLFMNVLMGGDILIVSILAGRHEENFLPGFQIFFEIAVISYVLAHRLLGVFFIILHEVGSLLFSFNLRLVDELSQKVIVFVFFLDVQVSLAALEVQFS